MSSTGDAVMAAQHISYLIKDTRPPATKKLIVYDASNTNKTH